MTQSTDELERLLKAGTPGPWEVSERIKDWRPQVVSTEHGPICTMHIPEVGDANPNAALICAAVNALPELLAKVKRLEEALKIKNNKERLALRHAAGGVSPPWMQGDNLAIVLCSDIEKSSDDDDEEEDESGWKVSTVEQCDATVDAIVDAVLEALTRAALNQETKP